MKIKDLIELLIGRNKPRPNPVPVPPLPFPADISRALLDGHNEFRSKNGKTPLILNSKLTLAASEHSSDMAKRQILSHFGSNGSTMGIRIRAAGYNFSAAGENVAEGQTTVEDVMRSWINSSGHRANILGNYRDFGGSAVKSSDGNLYWTTVFGSEN